MSEKQLILVGNPREKDAGCTSNVSSNIYQAEGGLQTWRQRSRQRIMDGGSEVTIP